MCVFLSSARTPDFHGPFDKRVSAHCGRGTAQSWDLRYGYMSFADWLWSVIAPALALKMISNLLGTSNRPWRIRCQKTQNTLIILVTEYAEFSLHEKWNNCSYLTVNTVPTKDERAPENTPLGLARGFFRSFVYSSHSLVYCKWQQRDKVLVLSLNMKYYNVRRMAHSTQSYYRDTIA